MKVKDWQQIERGGAVLTERQLLPGVGGKGEPQHSHGGYEHAWYYQVEEIVQSSPSDLEKINVPYDRTRSAHFQFTLLSSR